jgi:hypothetical protein
MKNVISQKVRILGSNFLLTLPYMYVIFISPWSPDKDAEGEIIKSENEKE